MRNHSHSRMTMQTPQPVVQQIALQRCCRTGNHIIIIITTHAEGMPSEQYMSANDASSTQQCQHTMHRLTQGASTVKLGKW
jgi:hypothetical protein